MGSGIAVVWCRSSAVDKRGVEGDGQGEQIMTMHSALHLKSDVNSFHFCLVVKVDAGVWLVLKGATTC